VWVGGRAHRAGAGRQAAIARPQAPRRPGTAQALLIAVLTAAALVTGVYAVYTGLAGGPGAGPGWLAAVGPTLRLRRGPPIRQGARSAGQPARR
jgi:hypothetical protein